MSSPSLRWQGGAELREGDGVVRVGALYVDAEALYFVESGRLKAGRFLGPALLAIGGGLALLSVVLMEGSFWSWPDPAGRGATRIAAEVALAVAGVLLGVTALWTRGRVEERHRALLAELGHDEGPLLVPLEQLDETFGDTLRVALTDLREVTPRGDLVELRTRLDDRYTVRAVPDPDGFHRALSGSL